MYNGRIFKFRYFLGFTMAKSKLSNHSQYIPIVTEKLVTRRKSSLYSKNQFFSDNWYNPAKILFFLLFVTFTLFLTSCNSVKNEKKYEIGIDPSFYPLGLGKLEKNTDGFVRELLLEMSEVLNIRFFVIRANWDNLFYGLEKSNYHGAVSSKYPYSFSSEKYNFSDLLLETGPALIVRKGAKDNSLEKMGGKLVGYIRGEESIFILEKYPTIVIKTYDSIPPLLEDLKNGFLDGAIADRIKMTSFVNNLYFDSLEVVLPLTKQGLRLVSLKKEEEIIKLFNSGLSKLEKKGIILKLKKKWSLS
jgi:polar amino acid transport system substrate-binding protein